MTVHSATPPLGFMMIGVSGLILTETEKVLLKHPLIAGVILFSRNFQDRHQLLALTTSIKKINPDHVIAVDHEGGRVQRFKHDFTLLPDMRAIGQLCQQNPQLALDKAYSVGVMIGIELIATGIDFSFTPVCDLDYQNNAAIGNRAFSKNPNHVSQLTCALHNGLKAAGSIGVAKHFPGHGYVSGDSHNTTPVDTRPLNVLEHNDIVPFKALITQHIEGIMPAHIVYPALDPDFTAVSSQKWMHYLRDTLGFNGIIISDDFDMQGAISMGDAKTRAHLCFNAGIDLLLCCNQTDTIVTILGAFPLEQHPNLRLKAKMLGLRANKTYPFDFNKEAEWQTAHSILFS